MFGLTTALKDLLNKFSETQPALQTAGLPFPQSSAKLGDLLDEGLKTPKTLKATYSFATNGGTVGVKTLSAALPAGTKILRCYTDATTAMTSGGAATVALDIGATSLKAATAYNDATLVGFDAQTLTAVKLAAAGALTFTIAGAALTAGVVTVYVDYYPA